MSIHDKKSVANIIKRNKRIDNILNTAYNDLALRSKTVKGIAFNNVLRKEIKALRTSLKANITKEITQQWNLGSTKIKETMNDYLDKVGKGVNIPDEINQTLRAPNLNAMNTFLDRTERGMNLSKKIWRTTKMAQTQIQDFLASGVTTGKSAIQTARSLKQFMKGTPIIYKGTLIKGSNINFQAIRLAATEANMAFRLSEEVKIKKLPFVTGQNIDIGGGHPRPDICDELAGDYPKDFIWGGWHPLCICVRTWKMVSKKEFVKMMKTGKVLKGNLVRRIPVRAKAFMKTNLKRFKGYIGRGTEPYWMRDNFTKELTLRDSIGSPVPPVVPPVSPIVPITPKGNYISE